MQPSDEEIHGYPSDSLDDEDVDGNSEDYEEEKPESDDDSRPTLRKRQDRNALSPASEDEGPAEDEEERMAGWGSSKKDYYDADVIETEADALEEEEEAKKIQRMRLQAMNEADFGFDEDDWAGKQEDDEVQGKDEEKGPITEVLPELQVTNDMSSEDRLKALKQRYPEFEPLSKDFVDLQPIYQGLVGAADSAAADTKAMKEIPDHALVPVIQFRALSAYLGAISMYFVLLTSPTKDGNNGKLAMRPSQLREHAIMETLVNCRKQWEEVRGLRAQHTEIDKATDESWPKKKKAVSIPKPKSVEAKEKPVKKQKKTKAQKSQDDAQALSEKRRAERAHQTEVGLAELSRQLESDRRKPRTVLGAEAQQDNSEFGDETGLTAHEAEEKAKKRKSLRFYTSQIAQKASKRSAAGRDAGGDTDLPYRERLKDRQARLNVEAEKRGRGAANEAERLGGYSDEEDHRIADESRGAKDGSDNDDYYDMVVARNREKKASKQKRAEAHAEAARAGGHVEVQEETGPDGKRAITYAIEKNKGLTPKRNKDARNPRVKKRKKFDQKQKKLSSIRQVYKGGEGRGGYGGELTGIKKNLVKSVKL